MNDASSRLRRRGVLPHVVLALVYAGTQFVLAGLVAWTIPDGVPADIAGMLLPFVAALPAVWVARRVGLLSYAGVAFAASAVVTLVCIAIIGIHVWIALPTGVPMGVIDVAAMFGRLFVFGGWPLAQAMLAMVLAPVAWLKVLEWKAPAVSYS